MYTYIFYTDNLSSLFNFIGEFSAIRKNSGLDYEVCYNCLFNPNKDECTDAVEIAMAEEE